jgi:hypothetical protein
MASTFDNPVARLVAVLGLALSLVVPPLLLRRGGGSTEPAVPAALPLALEEVVAHAAPLVTGHRSTHRRAQPQRPSVRASAPRAVAGASVRTPPAVRARPARPTAPAPVTRRTPAPAPKASPPAPPPPAATAPPPPVTPPATAAPPPTRSTPPPAPAQTPVPVAVPTVVPPDPVAAAKAAFNGPGKGNHGAPPAHGAPSSTPPGQQPGCSDGKANKKDKQLRPHR